MTVYTIGFTKKTAEQFFELIRVNKIQLLIDVRLNNASQLDGFSKGRDLKYFLSAICDCDYTHAADFAPTKELRDRYRSKEISWKEYEEGYSSLIEDRNCLGELLEQCGRYENVCLLCSESEATHCHRRLAAEMLADKDPKIRVRHI